MAIILFYIFLLFKFNSKVIEKGQSIVLKKILYMTNLWIPSVSIEHQSNHSIFTKIFLNHIQILFLLSKLNFNFGQIGIYISEGLANTISLITSLADCYLI